MKQPRDRIGNAQSLNCFAATEQGAVFVLVTFLFLALFAVGALAVDAGNIYRSQLQLQRAADAGVLAGLGYTILQETLPTDPADLRSVVEEKAREIAELNIERSSFGYSPDSLTIETEYLPDEHSLRVAVRADIDLYLIDIVPFAFLAAGRGASTANLGAEAGARRAPANISLVLDYSDSMQCPANGTCNCRLPTRTTDQTCEEEAALSGQQRKIDELRDAVETFVSYFDESRDRIGLTLFNIAAKVEVPARVSPQQGFDPMAFSAIGESEPASNTNVCDGLMRAYHDMGQAGIAGQEESVYIVFSDGAPTAGRFLLASPHNLAPNQLPGADSFGEFDYTHYSVEWVTDSGRHHGPSSLLRAGSIPFNYNSGLPPSTLAVPDCSPFAGSPPSDPEMFDDMFTSCIDDLAFHLPGMASTVRAADTGFDWREQYYHCSVEMADFIRQQQGLVFSIGLGTPAPMTTDPYQDIESTFARKDVLLSRLANDFFEAVNFEDSAFRLVHPEFHYNGYQTYQQWSEQSNPRIGRYYATPDSEELSDIFRAIAQRVLLRLLY